MVYLLTHCILLQCNLLCFAIWLHHHFGTKAARVGWPSSSMGMYFVDAICMGYARARIGLHLFFKWQTPSNANVQWGAKCCLLA